MSCRVRSSRRLERPSERTWRHPVCVAWRRCRRRALPTSCGSRRRPCARWRRTRCVGGFGAEPTSRVSPAPCIHRFSRRLPRPCPPHPCAGVPAVAIFRRRSACDGARASWSVTSRAFATSTALPYVATWRRWRRCVASSGGRGSKEGAARSSATRGRTLWVQVHSLPPVEATRIQLRWPGCPTTQKPCGSAWRSWNSGFERRTRGARLACGPLPRRQRLCLALCVLALRNFASTSPSHFATPGPSTGPRCPFTRCGASPCRRAAIPGQTLWSAPAWRVSQGTDRHERRQSPRSIAGCTRRARNVFAHCRHGWTRGRRSWRTPGDASTCRPAPRSGA